MNKPPRKRRLTRQDFLKLGGGALAGGCILGAATLGYYVKSKPPEHPYLLAHSRDFASVKDTLADNAQARSYREDLGRRAEEILNASTSFYRIPDPIKQRPHILWISRQVLERVYTLAMLYRLDGTQQYAERAWEELRAAADFPDWYPTHFLSTAEMCHAFAIGYDWLYDTLTEEQRAILRVAILEKGIRPALKRYRTQKDSGWVTATNNWNLVCNGGIGMGALAIKEDAPDSTEVVEEVLESALQSLAGAMSQFAPDGGWGEGITYWGYGTYYVTLFFAALEASRGVETKLLRSPGFADTGFFPLYLTGPNALTFNFADAESSIPSSPHLFWHSREFRHPVYDWYQVRAVRYSSPHALDLLWYNPPTVKPQEVDLPLDKHFRGTGLVTFRSAWGDPDSVFVGFKAGGSRLDHRHLDQGSFVLDALGTRWALDLGASNYSVPGYGDDSFSGQRWTYYRTRAEGHNTLAINPGSKPDQDPEADPNIFRFHSESHRVFSIADLTPAYSRDADKVWRGIALLDRKQVLVQDEVETTYPAEVWWFMHTNSDEISLDTDGTAAILTQGRERLWVGILSPSWATLAIMDARPLSTSPDPAEQGESQGVRKLGIHLTDLSNLQLSVLLVPLRAGDIPPSDLPEVRPLAEW